MIEYRKTFFFAVLALAALALVSLESLQYVRNHLTDQYWILHRRMRRNRRKANKPRLTKTKTKTKKAKGVRTPRTPEKSDKLDLVLFLGYPFAGTQATIGIMQKVTGYSMATNYGDMVETRHGMKRYHFESKPVDKSAPLGPFQYRMDLPLPPGGSDILVKTHASGHCMDMGAIVTPECTMGNTVVPLTDLKNFFESAAYAFKYHPKMKRTTGGFYNPHRSKKVVYLVRDPIEILESRWLNWVEGNPKENKGPIQKLCDKLDNHQRAKVLVRNWYPEKAKELAQKTPCHTELYRIVRYYIQASRFEEYMAASEKKLAALRGVKESGKEYAMEIHFNDWDTDYFGTLNKMLSFVKLRSKESGLNTQYFRRMKGLVIPDTLTDAQREAAWEFIVAVIDGDEDILELFSRYMPKSGKGRKRGRRGRRGKH